jgi:hypothetical protein
MTELWRTHIRPRAGEVDTTLSYAHCLKVGVIGVRWPLDTDDPLPLGKYLELGADAYDKYQWRSAVRARSVYWHRWPPVT